MKLFFRKMGSGKPLFILHGLFGSSDNWQTLGKRFAENYTVYFIDQRNHGRSPHSPEHTYKVMSDDLTELIEDEKLDKVILMGHSMGGKTAMYFAVNHPEKVDKIVVVDIGPKEYPITNKDILDAVEKVKLKDVNSRKQVEEVISHDIKDPRTVQFILKNLYWDDNQKLTWRFNTEALKNALATIAEATPIPAKPLQIPALFIKGEQSEYVAPTDMELINRFFSNARLVSIPQSGHWVHADNPGEFYKVVMEFLNR